MFVNHDEGVHPGFVWQDHSMDDVDDGLLPGRHKHGMLDDVDDNASPQIKAMKAKYGSKR